MSEICKPTHICHIDNLQGQVTLSREDFDKLVGSKSDFDAMVRKVEGLKIPYVKIRDKCQESKNEAIDEVLKILRPEGQGESKL